MHDTKAYILKVAFKLFLQKNFKEVTLKEIVEKTGLSKGAFYHYFESKEKLFHEIIDYFFSSVIDVDFDSYSKESLQQFYFDCTNKMDTLKIQFDKNEEESVESYFNMNFFFLIFDALKMFPEFRERMKEYHRKELMAWTDVIKKARESGEIRSSMNDKQIAMIFIHTSDGVAMNLVLNGNLKNLKKELKLLWDRFYESLKV
jgi:TetR/AcrR family transcriptional repressor of nem operon